MRPNFSRAEPAERLPRLGDAEVLETADLLGVGEKVRTAAVVALALLVLAPSAGAVTVTERNPLEPSIVQRINAVRKDHGLRALTVAKRLTDAASRHARSMGASSYFRHELYTPQGARTWTPFSAWIRWYWPGPGYRSWSAGENLAWGAPDISASRTVTNWMNSSGHRANILNPRWRYIGLAAVHVDDPAGYYRSWDDVTIVAAEFGARG
jgi:uncharacterized protein YkwD